MRSTLLIIGLLLTSLTASTSHADLLPPSKQYSIDGETRACFNLAGYKSLLKLAVDLGTEMEKNNILSLELVKKDNIIVDLDKQIKAKDNIIELYKVENLRITHNWEEENRKRHLAENKFDPMKFVYLGAAGVFLVSTVVLGAVIALN